MSCKSLLVASLLAFLCCPLPKLPPASNFKHLLGQELSSINFYLLFFRCSLMVLNHNLFLTEIPLSGLLLHLLPIILASFLSSVTTSLYLTDQVSLLYNITLRTLLDYDLLFAPKGKLGQQR